MVWAAQARDALVKQNWQVAVCRATRRKTRSSPDPLATCDIADAPSGRFTILRRSTAERPRLQRVPNSQSPVCDSPGDEILRYIGGSAKWITPRIIRRRQDHGRIPSNHRLHAECRCHAQPPACSKTCSGTTKHEPTGNRSAGARRYRRRAASLMPRMTTSITAAASTFVATYRL